MVALIGRPEPAVMTLDSFQWLARVIQRSLIEVKFGLGYPKPRQIDFADR